MYNFTKRLLSFLLFIVLLCYNLLNSTINVFAIVDYSSQATEIGLEEAKYECAEEAMLNLTQESDIDISKDNFYKLHNRDGLPYNYIHILVQHHIRCYNSILKDNELYIVFKR